jgi:hypothetical protein
MNFPIFSLHCFILTSVRSSLYYFAVTTTGRSACAISTDKGAALTLLIPLLMHALAESPHIIFDFIPVFRFVFLSELDMTLSFSFSGNSKLDKNFRLA